MTIQHESRRLRWRLRLMSAVSAVALGAMTAAAQAGTIQGRATEGTGTVGLQGATVRILETGQTVSTLRDGSYRLPNVAPGTYTLEVTYFGTDKETASVTVSGDGTVSRDFALGANEKIVDNLLVIGQRGQANSAISQQRAADNLISVISADAIGQLPDQNPTEAARRVPGVSIETDQGEGRFIVIRGIDPNLNSTSINGVRISSPDGGDRKVALDVISSENLSGIEITKTLTPNLDGDGIGGNVDIQTESGLDRDGAFFKGSASGSYSEIVEEWSPKLSAAFSNNWNDKFGVAGSLTWYDREFGSDNMEADDSWGTEDADDGEVTIVEEVELRDYRITRERLTAALNFDLQATDDTRLYLYSLFSDFEDDEFRATTAGKFANDNFSSSLSSAGRSEVLFDGAIMIDDGEGGMEASEVEMGREMKDRLQVQQIWSSILGGQSYLGNWTLDYSVAYTHSEEEEPNRLDTEFAYADELVAGWNTWDVERPIFIYGDAATRAAFNDPENFEFDKAVHENNFTEDDEVAVKLDAQYDTNFGEFPGYIKFGAKGRFREKSRDNEVVELEWDGDDDLTLAQFATTVDYNIQEFGPVVDANAIRNFIDSNLGMFESERQEEDSLAADYEANEDIIAGYVMGRIDINDWRLIGGVRVEHTDFDATANVFNDGDAAVVQTSDDYTDVLPSIVARYEIQEDLIFRAGYYHSVARPNIEAVVPSIVIDGDEAEGGNPNLERQQAINLDIGFEYYPNNSTVVSAGFFHKDIKDFIAPFTFTGAGSLPFAALDDPDDPVTEFSTFANLDDADLFGFELNYQQNLDFLPEPFDGFLIGMNYTHVDGQAVLADGRKVPLPKQSENIFNMIVGYEKGPISIRAAVSRRGEYLDEIGEDFDRYKNSHTQWDIGADFKITDNLKVFSEVSNANDEPDLYTWRPTDGSTGEFLSQYDEFSYTAVVGAKFTY